MKHWRTSITTYHRWISKLNVIIGTVFLSLNVEISGFQSNSVSCIGCVNYPATTLVDWIVVRIVWRWYGLGRSARIQGSSTWHCQEIYNPDDIKSSYCCLFIIILWSILVTTSVIFTIQGWSRHSYLVVVVAINGVSIVIRWFPPKSPHTTHICSQHWRDSF